MSTQIPNRGIYDDEGKPEAPLTGPSGENKPADSSSDTVNKGVDRHSLGEQERQADSGSNTALDNNEQSYNQQLNDPQNNEGGFYRNENSVGGKKGRFSKLRNFRPNKTQVATLAIIGVVAGGGFFSVAMLSGPFQFVHMAQKFSKHFRSNQDFTNDRTSKILIYALAGKGAQNGRLGVVSNSFANRWEKKLLDSTGLKPVYSEPLRRFAGFEIVNMDRFIDFTGDTGLRDNRNSKKLELLMGKGGGIVNPDDVRDKNGTKLNIVSKTGQVNNPVLNLADQSINDRRVWIKSLGTATGTFDKINPVGSRLLVKRAGVGFHPMNKLKERIDNRAARAVAQKEIEENRERIITQGVEVGPDGLETRPGENDDGSPAPASEADQNVSDETRTLMDQFKESGALRTSYSAAVITGVLCVVKQYGNSVEDYKYTNNVLPMMRMGMNGVTTGNQVMAFDDFSMANLNILSEYLYDKEKKTSWSQAESIRAEDGKTGGVPMPKEAEVGGLTEKPKLFRVIDDIPVLGTVCDVQDFIGGLPVIKQAGDAIGSIASQAADASLALFGAPSTEELMQSSLKTVAGKSIDPKAKGADLGNMGNAGVYFAANDDSLTKGGRPLSEVERQEIVVMSEESLRQEDRTKSFAERYLDPYNSRSVTASIIDTAPSNTTQLAAMVSKPANVFGSSFSNLISIFSPNVKAAGLYDYGVPKFGYSVEEQQRAGFQYEYENPYENAYKYVEPELDSLNAKYGKCFGMTVELKGEGVSIKSSDKAVNIFKTYNPDSDDYEPDCDARANTDDKFNHYRFYLADAVTAVTLACVEGDDEEACAEVGHASGGTRDTATSGEGADKIVSVAEQEFEKNGNKVLEECGQNCGPEVQKYTGGPSGPGAPWCAWFVSWVYREAGYEFKGDPAGSDGNIPAVANLVTWFKNNGKHFTPDSDTKPQPGDVIMYGGNIHTGIVVKVDGDTIETIEGNTSADGNFSANGGTVGRKSFNYKNYTSRSIEFGRLNEF